jgi:hypothetical protein
MKDYEKFYAQVLLHFVGNHSGAFERYCIAYQRCRGPDTQLPERICDWLISLDCRDNKRQGIKTKAELSAELACQESQPKCECCGADDYEGELKDCPYCGAQKCPTCDMGDNVGCALCEAS